MIQDRYLVVHLIGKGGMGEVYLAVDQRLGSAVALKRTSYASDPALAGAFEREARILARLRHPVLPKVSDHFVDGGNQYLVMEHIAGDDLSTRLEATEKPFPLSWVMFWADQLLDALTYLHSHQPPIIHRDIKPQNLKLTDENHIILLDFGLSKDSPNQTRSTSGQSSGSVFGYTPHFAPMEQIRGTGTDARSDIYSLAATLYQLLTGIKPADSLTRADAVLNGSPDPVLGLHEVNPEIASTVSDVLMRALEITQDRRYKSAADMQRALRSAYSDMKDAMSAQTVMVPTPVVPDVAPSVEVPPAPKTGPLDATLQMDAVPLEATMQMDAAPVDSGPRQADIKTEVFLAHQLDVPESAESSANGEQTYQADATVPLISYRPEAEEQVPQEEAAVLPVPAESVMPSAAPEFFTSPNIQTDQPKQDFGATEMFTSDQASEVIPAAEEPAAPPPPPLAPVQPAKAKKSGSKKAAVMLLLLGGFFILVLGGGAAGWYFWPTIMGTVGGDATPSPTPIVEESPSPTPMETPSPTPEATPDESANANANVSVDATPTPAPMTTPENDLPPERRVDVQPQTDTKKRPARTPAQKQSQTPKPQKPNSGRTDILQ